MKETKLSSIIDRYGDSHVMASCSVKMLLCFIIHLYQFEEIQSAVSCVGENGKYVDWYGPTLYYFLFITYKPSFYHIALK